jgi:hypothetical protein
VSHHRPLSPPAVAVVGDNMNNRNMAYTSASAPDRESQTSALVAVMAARTAPKRRARCGGRRWSTNRRHLVSLWKYSFPMSDKIK